MDTTHLDLPELPRLLSDLELVARYGDHYSHSELMAMASTAIAILDSLIPTLEDPKVESLAQTAQDELRRLYVFPDRYTDGLIVAVLMVVQSALRQITTAPTD